MGTLGHDEELKRIRKQLIPKKVGEDAGGSKSSGLVLALLSPVSLQFPHSLVDLQPTSNQLQTNSPTSSCFRPQILTKMGPGMMFGGGAAAMGSGDLQTSLKVVAETDVELYHMHFDLFLKHALPKMLK